MKIEINHIPDLEIIKTTFLACGVEYNELTLLSRKQEVIKAKFISIFILCKKGTERKKICKLLGYKDHTTIVHALKEMDYRMLNDNFYKSSFLETLELLDLRPLKITDNRFVYFSSC